MTPCGFPHSDICGSTLICNSPQLFAAYHVFLRLPVPRHSPCALSSLTVFLSSLSQALRFSICQLKNYEIVDSFEPKFVSCSLFTVSIFSFQGAFRFQQSPSLVSWVFLQEALPFGSGGLKWTRTTDLTLIRRAL